MSFEDVLQTHELTRMDKLILDRLNIKIVRDAIEDLKKTDEILWCHGDSGKIVPFSKLTPSNVQCLPVYSNAMECLREHFDRLVFSVNSDEERKELHGLSMKQLNVEEYRKIVTHMTMLSPVMIVSILQLMSFKDNFCDGAFGWGIDIAKNAYLKGLLHLEDIWQIYMGEY